MLRRRIDRTRELVELSRSARASVLLARRVRRYRGVPTRCRGLGISRLRQLIGIRRVTSGINEPAGTRGVQRRVSNRSPPLILQKLKRNERCGRRLTSGNGRRGGLILAKRRGTVRCRLRRVGADSSSAHRVRGRCRRGARLGAISGRCLTVQDYNTAHVHREAGRPTDLPGATWFAWLPRAAVPPPHPPMWQCGSLSVLAIFALQ